MLAVGLLLTRGHRLVMALSSQILKTFKGRDAVTSLDNLLECCTALLANGFFHSVQSESSQPKLTVLPRYFIWRYQEFGSHLHNCPWRNYGQILGHPQPPFHHTEQAQLSLQLFTKGCCHQTNGIAFLRSFSAFYTGQLWLLQFFHFPFMSPTFLFPAEKWKETSLETLKSSGLF